MWVDKLVGWMVDLLVRSSVGTRAHSWAAPMVAMMVGISVVEKVVLKVAQMVEKTVALLAAQKVYE